MKQFAFREDPCVETEEELIASVSSSLDEEDDNYSGIPGKWAELRLYRVGKKFVCEEIIHSLWEGESAHYSGAVCDDLGEVGGFFGSYWLARKLYARAGITGAIAVLAD